MGNTYVAISLMTLLALAAGTSPTFALDYDQARALASSARVTAREVGVTTELFSGAFANADEALEWTLAWPAGAARLARIDPTLHERFSADAREALAAADMSWSLAFLEGPGRKQRLLAAVVLVEAGEHSFEVVRVLRSGQPVHHGPRVDHRARIRRGRCLGNGS